MTFSVGAKVVILKTNKEGVVAHTMNQGGVLFVLVRLKNNSEKWFKHDEIMVIQ